jgi:predicted RNA-binding protein YlxR (DUF448 family)
VSVASQSHRLRMCIGCRQRANKSDLLRVVARESLLVPDLQQQRLGRGAYLHRRGACLQSARQRQAFKRALRVSESVSFVQVDQVLKVNSSMSNLGSQSGDEMSTQ